MQADKLRNYVTQIEALQSQKDALQADITDIYTTAKAEGFDTKVMRQVIKLRKLDAEERERLDEETKLYLEAVCD